ncbi:MAG: hypothetical protein M1361_01035 [Patescibacteria group bacterium]|nr:hypothetical protein [Patescibacteria group bacterium]MCL5224188.1 hypothetical protein [Patescibacteria group bacterium]
MDKSYTKLKKLRQRDSEVEFEAEIPLKVIEENTARVLVEIGSTLELPGFRKGKIPGSIVKEHVDPMHLFEEAANQSLNDAIREIVIDSELRVVGSPAASLEKITVGSPIVFRVKVALYPAIVLPDYKQIAKAIFERKEDSEISDKELQQAVEQVQRMLISDEEKSKPTNNLPELTDDLVKKAGPFQNVAEFKDELKKQLGENKLAKQHEAKRDETLREIVKMAKLTVPALLVDQELERFKVQRDANIKAAGFSLEQYLKESGKTVESLAKEERVFTEDQLRAQFVISEIQKTENIFATQQEIEANTELLKFRYPDESEEDLKNMAEDVVMSRKTFDMLEGNKTEAAAE